MLLRRATLEDTPAIARVKVAGWQAAYRGLLADEFLDAMSLEEHAAQWAENLARPGVTIWVAEVEGEGIIAFGSSGPESAGRTDYAGELYAIYVQRPWHAQGIGRRLVARTADSLHEAGIDSMLVWVFQDNPSRRFYESLGGELLGQQFIDIGHQRLIEVAYGWKDLKTLRFFG